MLIPTFALVSALTLSSVDQTFVLQAQSACVAAVGKRPSLDGIVVQRLAAAPGDLPKLRISDRQSGGWLLAYYDAAGERAAYARAACLGAQLRLFAVELGRAASRRQWFSTVFTTKADYVAPPNQIVNRWTVPLTADGQLGEKGQLMIVLIMPHEQAHSFQGRAGAELPRWVGEGHAEWIGRKITWLLSPRAAQVSEESYERTLEASRQPVKLRSWGGVQVKREAIMRQVPVDERRKMEADPGYTAPLSGRSFSFGPGDVTSDEGNLKARYEASWRIFRDLETAHGQQAVQSWIAQLTARPGKVDGSTAVENAVDVLHEDLNRTLG
jgi:hypothetical protein